MKKVIRLTESDLTRIVKRVINEMYDVGTTVELTKNGRRIKYTIDGIGTMGGNFDITLIDPTTKKTEFYDDRSINTLTDLPFKNGLLAIRSKKIG